MMLTVLEGIYQRSFNLAEQSILRPHVLLRHNLHGALSRIDSVCAFPKVLGTDRLLDEFLELVS